MRTQTSPDSVKLCVLDANCFISPQVRSTLHPARHKVWERTKSLPFTLQRCQVDHSIRSPRWPHNHPCRYSVSKDGSAM
eukprot:4583500-Amphidinium_carterae.1